MKVMIKGILKDDTDMSSLGLKPVRGIEATQCSVLSSVLNADKTRTR
jgi:hypothetical protein